MKNYTLSPLMLALACILSSFLPSERTMEEPPVNVQGTWILMMESIGESNDLIPPQRGYIKKKIITGKHFSWAEYTKNGDLVTMGGGTYDISGNKYTENIEYCYPKGNIPLGVSISFTHKFDGEMWLHSGYLQIRELDGETGEYVVTDTEKISEVWKRVK